jgi:glutaredoxin
MFLCYLCEKERVYTSYFCEDCRKIKNIMNVYGKDDVLSILQTACLRDQNQIGYKLNKMIKDSGESKKSIVKSKEESKPPVPLKPNVIDKAHGLDPVKTRSQVKKSKN